MEAGRGGIVSLGIQRYNRPAELKGECLTFVPLAVILSAPVFMLIVHSAVCWQFSFLKMCPLDAFFDTVQLSHTQPLSNFQIVHGLPDMAVHNVYKRGFYNVDRFFSLCLEGSMEILCPFQEIRKRKSGGCS